jgi:hypothetical protein
MWRDSAAVEWTRGLAIVAVPCVCTAGAGAVVVSTCAAGVVSTVVTRGAPVVADVLGAGVGELGGALAATPPALGVALTGGDATAATTSEAVCATADAVPVTV